MWTFANEGSRVLTFYALWVFAGSCLASELPMPMPLSTGTFAVHAATAREIGSNKRIDVVSVEPRGRGPEGFRFQIVLDSPARGRESSLDLAVSEGGLLITARDVDGIGNDLDLIIKSAKSFTPIGVWINDHRGGFTKADSSMYAPSIWTDCPLIFAYNPPDTIQRALLSLPQPCIHPLTRLFPYARWRRRGIVGPPNFACRSRLTIDPQKTRGPPSSI